MDNKLSELKAAAMAATPGPWRVVDQACRWNIDDDNGVQVAITQQRTSIFKDRIQKERTANADFIAAANPAVVLSLLAELEAKDKRITELEAKMATPVRLPEKLSMLHRTGFHEGYQSTMAFKADGVIAALREHGGTIEGDE